MMFKQPSVMTTQQHFSQIPRADVPRSKFDRSSGYKTTFDGGLLVPVYVDEVLPGDTFTMNSQGFVRLATPLKPIMDNIFVDMHFFFVPNRLVWPNWQKFLGERTDPDDNPDDYSIPTITANLASGPYHLYNYMGIPYRPGEGNIEINALPFRAYQLIYNEWFRDQNLQDTVDTLAYTDGDHGQYSAQPFPRGKRHDYFTSCLPWPQKGDEVIIPLDFQADVIPDSSTDMSPNFQAAGFTSGGESLWTKDLNANQGQGITLDTSPGAGGFGSVSPLIWDDPKLLADLSSGNDITINDLRSAFQVQKLLERDARGGTRYVELILNHFGVHSPDGRMQRPELLGSSTDRININPIAQTAQDATSPQGNLAAVGTGLSRCSFQKSFTEHGFIIGICSTRADLTYQQGVERMWWNRTRYDLYWPSLAHLGEQAVLQREIYCTGTAEEDEAVFGYQERYAEYRYKPSRVTGLFFSEHAQSLDVWHLSQEFATAPALNSDFIEEDPPFDRIIAVQDEPHFLADFWFDLKCDRPMPVYSVPGLIDHF
jgi:hypothetical protein